MRQMLSSALKLRARSSVLAQDAAENVPVRHLAADFQELDQIWRQLAWNLQEAPGTGRATRDAVAALTESDRKITELFSMRPQLNRRELISQTAVLTADLRNLLDDIEIEYGRRQDTGELLLDGR